MGSLWFGGQNVMWGWRRCVPKVTHPTSAPREKGQGGCSLVTAGLGKSRSIRDKGLAPETQLERDGLLSRKEAAS